MRANEVLMFLLPCFVLQVTYQVVGFPEQGKWKVIINETHPYLGIYKSVYKGSQIYVGIKCTSLTGLYDNVTIGWRLRETPCWEDFWKMDLLDSANRQAGWKFYYESTGDEKERRTEEFRDHLVFKLPSDYRHRCDNTIHLTEYAENCTSNSYSNTEVVDSLKKLKSKDTSYGFQPCPNDSSSLSIMKSKKPIFTIPKDGVYLFLMRIESDREFHAEIDLEIKGEHGFLSATDYPLLIFYGSACILYTIYGIVWLILSFLQWRDLIRIQFWIGAVIFIGMIEMAVFYAEYYRVNSSGVSVKGAVLAAEIISCAKRMLARMLVVVVSIGFGIVKPRLGSTFHRIVVVGALYFGFASFEASLRVLHPNGPSNKALMAGIPLSVLDAGIFYWIFQSLSATSRTLRLRRNLVKLHLYRHFTNTLIFCICTSVAFMIWSIYYLKTTQCLEDWKEIWVDEAYWHVLFSVILLVIMILWRPSNNNQRFSFSPLIDNVDEEEEEDLVVNLAFAGNMKLRNGNSNGKVLNHGQNHSAEHELRWTDESIPADLGEGDLPALDSEEVLNAIPMRAAAYAAALMGMLLLLLV